MTLRDPDPRYDWHDGGSTWHEIKAALALTVTIALAAILLF